MYSFGGNHLHLVDEKGRVAIPARFREVLSGLQEERLLVTKFKRRERACLDVYPWSAWLRFLKKLTMKKRDGQKVSVFENWYVGAAQDVVLDAQGRLLIPPDLREYAGLGRQVVVAGANQKFRVWNKELYQEVSREDEREAFQDPRLLEELDL